MWSILFSSVCFAIITATTKYGDEQGNKMASNAAITFIYLFGIVFSFGVSGPETNLDSLQHGHQACRWV